MQFYVLPHPFPTAKIMSEIYDCYIMWLTINQQIYIIASEFMILGFIFILKKKKKKKNDKKK